MSTKEEIGKGIRSLLQDIDAGLNTPGNELGSSNVVNTVLKIPLSQVEINPFQPRMDFDEQALRELAGSIRTHGLIQPISVRRVAKDRYQLIAGERRLKASKMAGMNDILAYLRAANDREMLEIALVENTHREDLNALEIAINYKRLIDECQLRQEELADRVGKDRTTVTNYLRLLKLPPEIQVGLRDHTITMGHARCLINIGDTNIQVAIFKEIVKKDLSVRVVEAMSRRYVPAPEKPVKSGLAPGSESGKYAVVQNDLRRRLGSPVSIRTMRTGGGEIVIRYSSDEDLKRLASLLGNK